MTNDVSAGDPDVAEHASKRSFAASRHQIRLQTVSTISSAHADGEFGPIPDLRLQVWGHLEVVTLKAIAMSAVAGVSGLLFGLGLSIAELFD